MAMQYGKGSKPANIDYAKGGPCFRTRSQFMKTPDTFRTSLQKQDYDKQGKGGTLSKMIEKKA
jgi:hypothetical protein